MAKHPQQIVEEQLVAQMQKLCNCFAAKYLSNSLKVSGFENLILKLFTKIKKGITFVPTVLATLPVRTASQGEAFAFIRVPFLYNYTSHVFFKSSSGGFFINQHYR